MKRTILFCLSVLCTGALLSPQLVRGGPISPVVAGNSAFAVDLYSRLRGGDGNLFFSPYSISAALAMTSAGARGETALQMARTLHLDLPADQLHPAFFKLESDLNAIQKQGQVQLAVADSLWPQVGFDFRPDYMALCKRYYGAAIVPVDFARHTEAARTKINGWVSDRTHRHIPELLKPGTLDKSNRLVLVNAIYFKGNWQSKFDSNATRNQLFHISSKASVTAALMRQVDDFGYAEFPGLQVLSMNYAGRQMSMIVLLPRDVDGLSKLESQLTAENLKTWTRQLYSRRVQVYFPKFTLRSEFSLADTLSAMGMPDAFDMARADFSGMDGRMDLYISRVVHEACVKVGEKGTEAAAATAVMMELGAAVPVSGPNPIFRADHPFLFLIRENQTGGILFLGRVTDPTQ